MPMRVKLARRVDMELLSLLLRKVIVGLRGSGGTISILGLSMVHLNQLKRSVARLDGKACLLNERGEDRKGIGDKGESILKHRHQVRVQITKCDPLHIKCDSQEARH